MNYAAAVGSLGALGKACEKTVGGEMLLDAKNYLCSLQNQFFYTTFSPDCQ
jgi:hypothetical protein